MFFIVIVVVIVIVVIVVIVIVIVIVIGGGCCIVAARAAATLTPSTSQRRMGEGTSHAMRWMMSVIYKRLKKGRYTRRSAQRTAAVPRPNWRSTRPSGQTLSPYALVKDRDDERERAKGAPQGETASGMASGMR